MEIIIRSLSRMLLCAPVCATAPGCTSDPAASIDADGRGLKTAAQPVGVEIPSGRSLRVHGTVRVAPGEYLRPPLGADRTAGVIVIEEQENVVLDLTGVTLRGTKAGTDLDQSAGWGILIKGCQDVTIRGGTIGGYKVCIAAFDCGKLAIEGVTFDGWYAQHLLSTAQAEDGSDWLFPHENDANEWITNHGAAISLTDCVESRIQGCRGRHGQNGILLTRTSAVEIFDDDFSFLSGWGLALYRSSKNVVSHDLFDYCVRGYSHGVYWRGQDSAGILMFERCCDNLFAFDSATHSGDGLFLFAGNDTVGGKAFERGELDAGGSDRNIWYRNDFSYAVANAIEATFSSQNWAIGNTLNGSHQHGVWGGYSNRMVVLDNEIHDTLGGGVSIEHGQDCVIARNSIERNDMGVQLWWDEDKELVGGPFGQHRDTSSRDHWILKNAFAENAQDIVLEKTSGVTFSGNRYTPGDRPIKAENLELAGASASDEPERNGGPGQQPDKKESARDEMAGLGGGLPSGHASNSSVKPSIDKEPEELAKARDWKCPEVPGKLVTSAEGRGQKRGLDTIVMGEWGPWDFRSGEPKPKQRVPGGLLEKSKWDAGWFAWRDAVDPRKDLTAWRALRLDPLVRAEVPNFVSPRPGDADPQKLIGNDRYGLIASTMFEVKEAGEHRLMVVSDDGVRVMIDGQEALENWTWHGPTRDVKTIDLKAGPHRIELEYFQIDGASALSIELEKVVKK